MVHDGRMDGQKDGKRDIQRWVPHLKTSICRTECKSFCDEIKKGLVNQILLSKLSYIGQKYTISKLIKEEIEKAIA